MLDSFKDDIKHATEKRNAEFDILRQLVWDDINKLQCPKCRDLTMKDSICCYCEIFKLE